MFKPIEDVNDWLRAFCAKQRIFLVDAYIVMVDHDQALAVEFDSGDGVHLNGKGYEAMGRYIAAETRDIVSDGDVVACLGDSLTEGYPGHFIGGEEVARWKPYPFYLEREGITVLNFGRCGDTTDGLMRRFHQEVRPHRPAPTVCIVHGGVNDLFLDMPPGWVTQNLADVYKACKRHDIMPMAVTLLPVSSGLWG